MEYVPSDNVTIIDSLSEEDKNDVLNLYLVLDWQRNVTRQHCLHTLCLPSALYHALTRSDEDFKRIKHTLNSRKRVALESYFWEDITTFLTEKLEKLLVDGQCQISTKMCW